MRVDGHGLCSCTASNGGATLSTNPYSALSSRTSGSPGFCEASPPGPPREPAGTSSSAEALPHGLAHASGALPRAIDTWPPEMTPLLVQFHPAAANSMQVVGGFSTLSPWTTTANEQTKKVRLPNNKTVDRLLLEMGKEEAITHRLDVAFPKLHRLFCTPGLDDLAGWCR